MLLMKNCTAILLISLCCVATLVAAQRTRPTRPTSPPRTPPPREEAPTLDLVDNRPGYSPLYQGTVESSRIKGRYIISMKKSREHDDLGLLLSKLSSQNKDAPSGSVPVQGLSGYSTVGRGVMAELDDDALDLVNIVAKYVL